VGPKVSDLTYKSRAKLKILRGIYSAIYGEVNISVSVCVEIKGEYIEKRAKLFYFCHLKKLVRQETFGTTLLHIVKIFLITKHNLCTNALSNSRFCRNSQQNTY
jgi:hypothetical protein